MDPKIPLVVPEVTGDVLCWAEDHLIANPNCSTIQPSCRNRLFLQPYGLKRVIYNTYQAVSGAGQAGINDLENHTTGKIPFIQSIK